VIEGIEGEDDVRHPEAARLIEHASQGASGSAVESHVGDCPHCKREVARWRHAIDACVWRDGGPETDEEACLDDHTLAALAEGSLPLPARENAVEHLAACARCRAEVASVTKALTSRSVRSEIDGLDRVRQHRWMRITIPLAAVATLAVLLVSDVREVDPGLHRAPTTPPAPAPVTIAPSGPTTSVQVLRWHAVTGADRYRVTLFDDQGFVLWESAVADTVAGLPADVALEPGRTYFWIVSARTGFDRWETSSLSEFSVAGGGAR
jgi:hypothetical protein